MKMTKKLSITTPLIAVTTVLLIAANILLGIILINQARSSMQSLIRDRMLDISNTAADMLDGDVMRSITWEDRNTPEYMEARKILRSFQDNIELEYIYAIRDEGGRYSFTIDPSDDPGEFGEEIAYTKALYTAAQGVASVDEEPYKDRWGRFYSAYSPIFDSDKKVAGIVGVDFSAEWYEDRVRNLLISVISVCGASMIIGIVLVFTVTSHIRSRFDKLYDEMNSLAGDFNDLNKLIKTDSEEKDKSEETDVSEEKKDEISMIGDQIRTLQGNLRQYLEYVHQQAFTDTMTGVGSKTAYLKKVKSIERHISDFNASFTVFVFDINRLKTVNDNYGHEIGDRFITDAASAISAVFGAKNVYRIGGDEFIAITDGKTPDRIKALFERLDYETEAINNRINPPVRLSVSKGAAVYDPSTGGGYQQVFKRADEDMYRNKAEFHARMRKEQPQDTDNNT